MALTLKDGYSLHMTYVKERLSKSTNRLLEISNEKKYLWDIITKNKEVYYKAGIDIDNLIYSNKDSYDKRLIQKYKFDTNESLLQGYIIAYFGLLKLEKVCINVIRQYSMLNIPFSFYKYLCTELNLEYSKEVLKGSSMDLSCGIGSISIVEKGRDFTKPSTCKAVNWNKSKKVKQALIDAGEIPYDKVNAPNGVKWHVKFDDDFSYWWWWKYRTGLHNGAYYRFVPTKFINGIARDVNKFSINFNTIDKILNSRLLGNIDKLYRIKSLFPTHLLNYKDNSIDYGTSI